MSVVKVVPDIYWVGARDFAVRDFHGYKTPYGTTYNAFLFLDEKVIPVDTVKAAFADEMIANIRELIDPAKIDCVVSNHVEPDHSGSLPAILALCPQDLTQWAEGVERLLPGQWVEHAGCQDRGERVAGPL